MSGQDLSTSNFLSTQTNFINGSYFSILLSVFKFAWLASFGLKYSFEFFTQRRGQPGKFEYKQKNTKIAAIYESGLLVSSFCKISSVHLIILFLHML